MLEGLYALRAILGSVEPSLLWGSSVQVSLCEFIMGIVEIIFKIVDKLFALLLLWYRFQQKRRKSKPRYKQLNVSRNRRLTAQKAKRHRRVLRRAVSKDRDSKSNG